MTCPYGQCRMRNLCHTHCVRAALEEDGWYLGADGQLYEHKEEPECPHIPASPSAKSP